MTVKMDSLVWNGTTVTGFSAPPWAAGDAINARDGQLRAYRHEGFWQPMDTLRDLRFLESLWQGGNPPWKSWK
jgi:hypothetical protein